MVPQGLNQEWQAQVTILKGFQTGVTTTTKAVGIVEMYIQLLEQWYHITGRM